MEDVERRRARCREYSKTHREELSAKRKQRYNTDEEYRERCKKASKKWYEKRKLMKGGNE